MNHPQEDPLTQAERHFREAQERISRQVEIIAKLDHDGHEQMAGEARGLMANLQQTLALAWWHLQMEREERGLDPKTGIPAAPS